MPLAQSFSNAYQTATRNIKYFAGLVSSILVQCWKQKERPDTQYSCIAIGPNKLFQAPNYEMRYHGRIEYVYFEADAFIREFMDTDHQVTVRITKIGTLRDLDRFLFSMTSHEVREAVIRNKKIKEIYIEGNRGSLIVRLTYTQAEGGGFFVYVVDSSNI